MKYIGVKIVEAEPITRGDYHDYREWVLPDDNTGADEGYLVKYPDGYESWCPKAQFEQANRPCDAMPFGHAIEAAKKGNKIARKGWNSEKMFVVVMPALTLPPFNTQGTNRKVNDRTAKRIGEDTPLNCVPYFAIYTANGDWVPGWLANPMDMLADDWMIIK